MKKVTKQIAKEFARKFFGTGKAKLDTLDDGVFSYQLGKITLEIFPLYGIDEPCAFVYVDKLCVGTAKLVQETIEYSSLIKRFNSYRVLVDYDTNDSTWDRNYRHVFDTQQQAEEFRAREYPAKSPSAVPADIELKALGIIIQQKGQDVAEYVTFEGSNYLFRSEDLAVKYGGKVENGQIVITPELESTYNRLRYEQMTASNSQLGQEYAAVKQVNPDSIVFYRIGDFYEVLGEDARRAAEVLDLTLTGRMLGDERIPMAGVPFHAIDEYAQKLAASGENVVVTGKDDGAKKINAVKALMRNR